VLNGPTAELYLYFFPLATSRVTFFTGSAWYWAKKQKPALLLLLTICFSVLNMSSAPVRVTLPWLLVFVCVCVCVCVEKVISYSSFPPDFVPKYGGPKRVIFFLFVDIFFPGASTLSFTFGLPRAAILLDAHVFLCVWKWLCGVGSVSIWLEVTTGHVLNEQGDFIVLAVVLVVGMVVVVREEDSTLTQRQTSRLERHLQRKA
jgi:hypothetical protein